MYIYSIRKITTILIMITIIVDFEAHRLALSFCACAKYAPPSLGSGRFADDVSDDLLQQTLKLVELKGWGCSIPRAHGPGNTPHEGIDALVLTFNRPDFDAVLENSRLGQQAKRTNGTCGNDQSYNAVPHSRTWKLAPRGVSGTNRQRLCHLASTC